MFFARFWRFCQTAKFFTASMARECRFFVEKSEMYKKIKKNAKKVLTRGKKGDKIVEPQNEREAEHISGKKSKKFKKVLKKVLTKEMGCDIIVKLSARRTAMVIEN